MTTKPRGSTTPSKKAAATSPATASSKPAATKAAPVKQVAKSAIRKAPAALLAVTPKVIKTTKAPDIKASEIKVKKEKKAKKAKMIRDSFTMPETDYSKLAKLKQRCLNAGVHVKKSELLRIGLIKLAKLSDAALLNSIGQLEKIKTGRPPKA